MKNILTEQLIIKTSRVQSHIRLFGFAGAIGAILFLIIFGILHILDSDVSPAANYVSEYANSPYGTLFRISLVVHGLGNIAIATGLAISLSGSRFGRLGAVLFGAAAVGAILGGIFSTDPLGAARSVSGTIHQIAAFGSFPLEAMALIFFSYAFRNTLSWNSFAATTMIIAVAGIAFILWLAVVILMRDLPGLAERAVLLTYLSWEILTAVRLTTYRIMSAQLIRGNGS